MPSKDFDYSIYQEPKKDWKKYYTDKINIISDWITEYFKDDTKKIDYCEKNIDRITICNIKDYHYWFTSRFFYWIYDFDKNKWWIRLHWVKADDFLIKVWLFKEWYYDVNILNFKWIFWWKKEIKNWPNVWHKKRFKNNNKECLTLDKLSYKLKLSWANTELNRKITGIKDSFYRWPALLKKLFNSQTKLLRYIRKQDKDRIQLKQSLYHNDNSYYEDSYVIEIKDSLTEKYTQLLTLEANVNHYLIEDLEDRSSYIFRIYAENTIGVSDYASSIEVTTQGVPNSPTNLDGSFVHLMVNPYINLYWNQVDDEMGYELEFYLGGWVKMTGLESSLEKDTSSISLVGFGRNTDYTFRIRAFNDYGYSEYSNEFSLYVD